MFQIPKNIQLPLYKNDGKPLFIFKRTIKEAVDRVNFKISSGFYKHILNNCLCGNAHPEEDVLISEKDMWGIALDSVVCSKCGLIRSKWVPDNSALADFYETEYKKIYYDTIEPGEYLYNSQKIRGASFLKLIEDQGILENVNTVFDYGCGMGGALEPFLLKHKRVSGCDYGQEYIDYGNQRNLNLYHGEIDLKKTPKDSQDLVMVSHVMEHFTDPIHSMKEIIEIVAPGKFLLVEVPGLYADKPYKYYPVWHLQKGHIYNFFYKDFLIEFFSALGLEVIYSNERCTFICRKPVGYVNPQVKFIDAEKLKHYPQKNLDYFLDSYRRFDERKWKHPVRIARQIMKLADFFRMRFILNVVIKESKEWTS